jgi:hypothetical protein
MEIIGMQGERYIAIVNHTELEKLAGKYYGNMPKLKIGDSFDIGAGYNFSSEIKSACHSMSETMKRFENAQKAITDFSIMVSKLPVVNDDSSENKAD